jgi:hypothetical protein
MKIPTPPIKHAISVLDAGRAAGQIIICPSQSLSDPELANPLDDPDRAGNVMSWNPVTMSFIFPNGEAIFCERLQESDPMSLFGSTPGDYVEGFGFEDMGDWAEAEDETD